MIVRAANLHDDAAIAGLLESVAMPGAMRLATACRQSFFDALRIEGTTPVVGVAENQGELIGVGFATYRDGYVNGRPGTLCHLGGLRVVPGHRNGMVLARAYQWLQRELANRPAAATLTSILESNTHALAILTSRRAGLPAYQPLCRCITRVIRARRSNPSASSTGIHVIRGIDAGELAAFLSEHGPAGQYFPQCASSDFAGDEGGRFPGLAADDFVVARDRGGLLLGAVGCWDVMARRQVVVTGYAGWLRRLRPWINLAARCSGRPALPAPGAPLRLMFGALACVRGNDPRVLRALLERARVETRRRGRDYLVIAHAAGHPWTAAFAGLPQRRIHSRIFLVGSNHTPPDPRPIHLEAAML